MVKSKKKERMRRRRDGKKPMPNKKYLDFLITMTRFLKKKNNNNI
jgi:hypothetical protein